MNTFQYQEMLQTYQAKANFPSEVRRQSVRLKGMGATVYEIDKLQRFFYKLAKYTACSENAFVAGCLQYQADAAEDGYPYWITDVRLWAMIFGSRNFDLILVPDFEDLAERIWGQLHL